MRNPKIFILIKVVFLLLSIAAFFVFIATKVFEIVQQ